MESLGLPSGTSATDVRSDRQRFLPPRQQDTAAKFHSALNQAFIACADVTGVSMVA
jgi:hypothetical protein